MSITSGQGKKAMRGRKGGRRRAQLVTCGTDRKRCDGSEEVQRSEQCAESLGDHLKGRNVLLLCVSVCASTWSQFSCGLFPHRGD